MKKFDYIVVGQGLAGSVLIFNLIKRGKSICLVDKKNLSASSLVAPGAYNPLVLKRFTPCWKVEEQLPQLYDFLSDFESQYNCKIHKPLKLWRKFQSVQEQNLWLEKSEKKRLQPFMNTSFIANPYASIKAPFGFGEVNDAGRVFLPKMINTLRLDLEQNHRVLDEVFHFPDLHLFDNGVKYKDVIADKIVFCEGHRMSENPHFSYLPLMRTKGELLTVRLKTLQMEELLKSSISVLPLGNDLYKVAATFNWEDKDELCTAEAREELLTKLETLVDEKPEVVCHEAGLRPTVKDRRALLGVHPTRSSMFLFNGLGTRGLLLAPCLSLQLIEFMESNKALDDEVDIKRFENMYTC